MAPTRPSPSKSTARMASGGKARGSTKKSGGSSARTSGSSSGSSKAKASRESGKSSSKSSSQGAGKSSKGNAGKSSSGKGSRSGRGGTSSRGGRGGGSGEQKKANPMLIYGTAGGSILLLIIIAVAASGGNEPPPPPAAPERPAVQATAPRTTAGGFVDDGKWREYIRIPVPNEPGEADARELRRRVNDLLYYAQNLEGEDRNSIYRYIVQLCQKAAESNSMPENWRQHFNKEWAQARRYITR